MHQMAAQSVGHMDDGRPRTGGCQWFAHLVSATVAFSSGSCANGAPWARTISLVGRWTLRSRKGRAFMWPEAVPQQSTAHDDLECSGHGRTGANRPPPPEAGFAQREPSGFPKPHQTVRFGEAFVSASADFLLFFSSRCAAASRTFKPSPPRLPAH